MNTHSAGNTCLRSRFHNTTPSAIAIAEYTGQRQYARASARISSSPASIAAAVSA